MASTFSKHPSRFPSGYPTKIKYGSMQYVWTPDLKFYVDWAGGLGGAGVLGHRFHPTLGTSGSYHLPVPEEQQAADTLCEILQDCGHSWAEGVRWCLNGTDATHTAVRLARAVTGRRRIGVFAGAYHGDSTGDVFIAAKSPARGIDDGVMRPAVMRWNRPEDLAFRNLAAVIFEVPLADPTPAFVDALHSYRKDTGCLLIADEVVTGFRLGLGGACSRYDIEPDIVCYGKALGSGVPIAAVVGRGELMREFDLDYTDSPVWASWTHAGHQTGVAAALRTLRYLRKNESDVYDRLAAAGRALKMHQGLRCEGQRERSCFVFADDAQRAMFWQEMAKRGHLVYVTNFPSIYHVEAAQDSAFAEAAAAVEERVKSGERFNAPKPLFTERR